MMNQQTVLAIRQIQELTQIENPVEAVDAFLENCRVRVLEDWSNYMFWRCLLLWGEILDPQVRVFEIVEVEVILGTHDLVEFFDGLVQGGVTDATINAVVNRAGTGQIDALLVGAIAALLDQLGYDHTVDAMADDGSRGCIGYIFGSQLRHALRGDY
jgi:hypothetical protein